MKKNLFEPDVVDETISRANNLTEESEALWGRMNVAEMLHHSNAALTRTLMGQATTKKSSVKQKVVKWFVLSLMKRFPKGATAPKEFDIKKNQIIPEEFEKEKKEFITLIAAFKEKQETPKAFHPVFGSLTKEEWGIFTWMHLDHHLRQFNV